MDPRYPQVLGGATEVALPNHLGDLGSEHFSIRSIHLYSTDGKSGED